MVSGLSYAYGNVAALTGVDLQIADGEAVALVGATGSGKTTLVQHFNALLRPATGSVVVDGIEVGRRGADLREIRRRVGLVFQYPEYQLFEESVAADIAFGPRNFGSAEPELSRRVHAAMGAVGLPLDLGPRSPFQLSGGQMRRVAIAGVLAMEPKHLVLDEPTAGLDPQGRQDLLRQLFRLHGKGMTLVLVTHRMEEAALLPRIVVMAGGRVARDGTPRDVFARVDELESWGLRAPEPARLLARLRAAGAALEGGALTADEACERVLAAIASRRGA